MLMLGGSRRYDFSCNAECSHLVHPHTHLASPIFHLLLAAGEFVPTAKVIFVDQRDAKSLLLERHVQETYSREE